MKFNVSIKIVEYWLADADDRQPMLRNMCCEKKRSIMVNCWIDTRSMYVLQNGCKIIEEKNTLHARAYTLWEWEIFQIIFFLDQLVTIFITIRDIYQVVCWMLASSIQ